LENDCWCGRRRYRDRVLRIVKRPIFCGVIAVSAMIAGEVDVGLVWIEDTSTNQTKPISAFEQIIIPEDLTIAFPKA